MSRYAIIESGSKQYRVEPQSVIDVEKLEVSPEGAKEITLDKVLLFRDGDRLEVGSPLVSGARVICDYLGEEKGEKTISFKYRRRKASRNRKGHRQTYTRLRVKEIKI